MKRIIALLSIGFTALGLHAASCDLLNSPVNITKGGTVNVNGGQVLGGQIHKEANFESISNPVFFSNANRPEKYFTLYEGRTKTCDGRERSCRMFKNGRLSYNVHYLSHQGFDISGTFEFNHKSLLDSIAKNGNHHAIFRLNDGAKLVINAPVAIHASEVDLRGKISFGPHGYLIITADNITYAGETVIPSRGSSEARILLRATQGIKINRNLSHALLMANNRITITSGATLNGALSTRNLDLQGTVRYLSPQGRLTSHFCAKERDMSIAFQKQLEGDIEIIGNSVLMKDNGRGGRECASAQDHNDATSTVYADVDADSSTKNSTSANLKLPVGAEVVWAGLYWQGFTDKERSEIDHVKLKTPTMTDYITITSEVEKFNNSATARDIFYHSYQGVADITEYVQKGGGGNYYIADVETLSGDYKNTISYGSYGAWAIAVVYKKNPSTSKDFKQITVYDGFLSLAEESKSMKLDKFFTPAKNELPYVEAELLLFSAEGDAEPKDTLTLTNKQGRAISLSNSLNPSDNIMNSTISRNDVEVTGANERNPDCRNTLGIDIDSFQVGNNRGALNIIGHEQTQTIATLTSKPDHFYAGLLALAISSYRVYDISKEFLPDDWCHSGKLPLWRREADKLICSGYIERPHHETYRVKIIASEGTKLVTEGNFFHDNRYKAVILPFVDIGDKDGAVKIYSEDGSVELSDSKVFSDIRAGGAGRISFSKNTFHGMAITKGKISSSNDTLSGCFQADGSQERDTSADLAGLSIHIGYNTKISGKISAYHKDVKFDKARNEGEELKILGQNNQLQITDQSHFTKTHVGGLDSVMIEAGSTLAGHLQDGITAPHGFTLDPALSALSNYKERCVVDNSAPTQGNFRVVEAGSAWNPTQPNPLKTKIFGNALSFDILHSINGATLIEGKIKKLELWDHSGTTPQLVRTILATETPITGGRLSINLPALAKPYRHLKFHITADDKGGVEQTTESDGFALRPARFELKALKKSTKTSPCDESAATPDLKAKAGEEFCLFAYAKDPSGNPIAGYNAGLRASDSLEIAYKEPKPKLRTGELTLNLPSISTVDVEAEHIKDGKLILPKVHYSEVGEPKLTLKERENREWALIDKDDTPDSERLIAPTIIQPEFTLAKFGFEDLKLTSKFGGNFSFFDLLPNPSATSIPNSKLLTLSYTLKAQNEGGDVTKNYVNGGYAKPVILTRTLPTGIVLPDGTELIHETQGITTAQRYSLPIRSETLKKFPDLTPTFPLNLPADKPDATVEDDPRAGTQTFTEEFSFAAPRTKPANPIPFHGTQPLALEAKETGDPNIKGEESITNDMTLYFARINALDSHQNEDGSSVKSKVYYEVYCKGSTSDECQGFDKANYSVNSAYWYKFNIKEGSTTPSTSSGTATPAEALTLKLDHFKVTDTNRQIAPQTIKLDASGFFVILEFDANNIANNTRRQGRIEHGNGKFPAFFYFHPYRDYKAGDTFTTFTVSKTNEPGDKENIVKTDSAKKARGASRVGD